MKRHPALVELSSDHHHGLVQARRLLKACETDPPDTNAGEELQRAASGFLLRYCGNSGNNGDLTVAD